MAFVQYYVHLFIGKVKSIMEDSFHLIVTLFDNSEVHVHVYMYY